MTEEEEDAVAHGFVVTRPATNGDAVEVYCKDYGISATGDTFEDAFQNLMQYCSEEDEFMSLDNDDK